jgi:hypothetical protein
MLVPISAASTAVAALPTQGATAYLLLTASTAVRPGESVLGTVAKKLSSEVSSTAAPFRLAGQLEHAPECLKGRVRFGRHPQPLGRSAFSTRR